MLPSSRCDKCDFVPDPSVFEAGEGLPFPGLGELGERCSSDAMETLARKHINLLRTGPLRAL